MVFPQQQQQQQQHQQMVRAVVKNTFVDMIDEEDLKKETGRPRAATCDGTLLRYTEGKPHMVKDNCEPLFTVTFGDSEPECEGSPDGTERTPGTPEPEPPVDIGYHSPSGQMLQTFPVGMASQEQPAAFCDPSGCAPPAFYAVCCTQQGMMMMQPLLPDQQLQFMFQQQQQQQPPPAAFGPDEEQQQQQQQQQDSFQQQRGFQQQQQQQQQLKQQSQWPLQQHEQHNQQQRRQAPQQHDTSLQQERQQNKQEQLWAKRQQIPEPLRTTVMLRNIPNGYCGDMLKELLDRAGFAGQYDFMYLPMDFRNHVNIGYAFVNAVDPAGARRLRETFDGFDGWAIQSSKICEVSWSHPQQGLAEHVERYRNSPVMHDSVPVGYKPRLFQNGAEVPFPLPTRPIKPLKLRLAYEQRFGV